MKYPSSFQEYEFRRSVDKALERVRTILDATRLPRLAHEEEDHKYNDKFTLVEFLMNTGISAQINALERLGLDHEKLKQIMTWIHDEKQTVTLRFHAEDSCSFLKEGLVEIQPSTSIEIETTKEKKGFGSIAGLTESIRTKVVTMVREYHWNVTVTYRIVAFKGPSPEQGSSVVLLERNATSALVISGGQVTPSGNRPSFPISPLPAHTINDPIDVDISWLFQNLAKDGYQCQFSIDRASAMATKQCKTPRRNEDVDDAVGFMEKFSNWARRTKHFFIERVNESLLCQHQPTNSPPEESVPDLQSVSSELLFVPVVPLMEKGSVLAMGDVECLLNEQKRSLGEGIAKIGETYPPTEAEKLVTASEAVIVLVSLHIAQIARHCEMGVDYIEEMLRKQVIKAIGKELKVKDFETFLKYHNQKLFAPGYAPRPFCYAIRRPEHYPDGVFTIEATEGDNEPIQTWVRHVPASSGISTMTIPIGAATVVELKCERYVHGWMKPIFHDQHDSFQAVARARQFSSFLLVVGTMSGPNRLDPKQAIILQNKDEIIIPLLIETLPSSKDFKDAISSLSPEQQEFAKTFRAMQLGSSVFGVCIIQLKPQLERLLRLPDGALTKEIKLTQDLMSLFVDYQIPSDLLSYNGVEDAPALEKVMSVKGYVQSVLDVVKGEKLQQLEDEILKADMRHEKKSGFESIIAEVPFARRISSRIEGSMPVPPSLPVATPQTSRLLVSSHSESTNVDFDQFPPPPPAPLLVDSEAPHGVVLSGSSINEENAGEIVFGSPDRNPDFPSRTASLHDFTSIPGYLDRVFGRFDTDNSMRSAVIKPRETWELKQQDSLLTEMSSIDLDVDEICSRRKKAFDLLDAISRSGALPIDAAELHVVVAVSHCFENDIMGSIIQDNINPIAKVEKSSLMIASTIHGISPAGLLAQDVDRLTKAFPELLEGDSDKPLAA